MSEKNIIIFDKLADQYDQWFDEHHAVFLSELSALKKVVPENGDGLEVGVGTGRFAAALKIKTGIDPSSAMQVIAKSRGIDVYQGVAESLSFSDNHFDFVLLVTTLCFIDDVQRAFLEIRRVLKPNGVFVIGDIDRNSPLGQSYESKKQENPFYQNAHFYSTEEILQLLKKTNFKKPLIYQTIFSPIKNIKSPEAVMDGYGKGGFVVIKSNK